MTDSDDESDRIGCIEALCTGCMLYLGEIVLGLLILLLLACLYVVFGLFGIL